MKSFQPTTAAEATMAAMIMAAHAHAVGEATEIIIIAGLPEEMSADGWLPFRFTIPHPAREHDPDVIEFWDIAEFRGEMALCADDLRIYPLCRATAGTGNLPATEIGLWNCLRSWYQLNAWPLPDHEFDQRTPLERAITRG